MIYWLLLALILVAVPAAAQRSDYQSGSVEVKLHAQTGGTRHWVRGGVVTKKDWNAMVTRAKCQGASVGEKRTELKRTDLYKLGACLARRLKEHEVEQFFTAASEHGLSGD